MSKRFGQNFLVNPNAREKIIKLLSPAPAETVWEIGPGFGAMTHMIAGKTEGLTVFEIDHGFCSFLNEKFQDVEHFRLVEGDFLKTWRRELEERGQPDCIIGNLPYNVGSIIIGDLIKSSKIRSRMVFTLQKEVVKRMAARPGSADYSGFSLICQFTCRVENHGDVSGGSFYPKPRVVSSIVRLTPHNEHPDVNRELFISLVNDMFAARRKTLRNNLIKGATAARWGREPVLEGLESMNLPEGIRGEKMNMDEVIALSNAIEKIMIKDEKI
ncbi:MAG: ribosomal RNA small subunit methyltransferase A [Spirochaetales bacterium]|nr:ribosomal RNA small subunit methyltransferase A [Spirochaetales bacterium]